MSCILILDNRQECWVCCSFPHREEMTCLHWVIRVLSPSGHIFAQLLTCNLNKTSIHLEDWYGHCVMSCVVPIWNARCVGEARGWQYCWAPSQMNKENRDLSCPWRKHPKEAEWGKVSSTEFPELTMVKVSQLLETNYMNQMNFSPLS